MSVATNKRYNIAKWLEDNLDEYGGLSWCDERNKVVRITWEDFGKPGYDDSLEVSKAYVTRTSGRRRASKPLTDSQTKSRFLDALEKSEYIEMKRDTKTQNQNCLWCKLLKRPLKKKRKLFSPPGRFHKLILESDCNNMEADILDVSNSASSQVLLPCPNIDCMTMDVDRPDDQLFSEAFLCLKEKMNNFKISLFYEGKLIKEEVMDLSRGVRFHYGSADMQRNNVLSCKPEFKHYYDCNTCQFPVDCQNNERLTKAFENAAQGILLKSTDGCLEGVRLSQMVIHRSLPHSGSCAKMERYKEEKLFTYEDYAVSFTTNPYLKQELILSFGKKPRLCIPSLIMLKLQPEFVQTDDHSSMSTSLQNSIDRLTQQQIASIAPTSDHAAHFVDFPDFLHQFNLSNEDFSKFEVTIQYDGNDVVEPRIYDLSRGCVFQLEGSEQSLNRELTSILLPKICYETKNRNYIEKILDQFADGLFIHPTVPGFDLYGVRYCDPHIYYGNCDTENTKNQLVKMERKSSICLFSCSSYIKQMLNYYLQDGTKAPPSEEIILTVGSCPKKLLKPAFITIRIRPVITRKINENFGFSDDSISSLCFSSRETIENLLETLEELHTSQPTDEQDEFWDSIIN